MSFCGEVLIAIVNNLTDMAIARDQHWYRIPIAQASKLQHQGHWPPQYLAFYQTRIFAEEAFQIHYYARVLSIQEVYRWELFPAEVETTNGQKRYCKLELASLQRLPCPIVSTKLRRITFIPTTWEQLHHAQEVRDLMRRQAPSQKPSV